MTCKGICLRHRAPKPIESGRYASGQKRCQGCEIFIEWDCLWCPCCGFRLRTRARNSACLFIVDKCQSLTPISTTLKIYNLSIRCFFMNYIPTIPGTITDNICLPYR